MKRKPNILFITADQMRFDAVLPHRADWLRVPHLDWLARTGMSFRNAYTTCPICVPARTTIMTGQFEWTHGMTENGETSRVIDDTLTLPARLRNLGYQTLAIGKMHFGPQRCRHGFDDCIIGADYLREMKESGNPLQPLRNGMGQNEYYPALSPVPEAMTYTSWISDRCVDFLHERRDPTRPFFLWCSYGKFEGPAELLFDLETDPREIRNLTNDPAHAEVKERLRQELIKRMSTRVCDAFLVEDGQLTSFPKALMPEERILRSSNWLGLHTEFYQGDVFH